MLKRFVRNKLIATLVAVVVVLGMTLPASAAWTVTGYLQRSQYFSPYQGTKWANLWRYGYSRYVDVYNDNTKWSFNDLYQMGCCLGPAIVYHMFQQNTPSGCAVPMNWTGAGWWPYELSISTNESKGTTCGGASYPYINEVRLRIADKTYIQAEYPYWFGAEFLDQDYLGRTVGEANYDTYMCLLGCKDWMGKWCFNGVDTVWGGTYKYC